jgi:predicted PurR-regulated permease PerM
VGKMREKIDIEKHSKYFFIACFIGIIILSIFVIKSYVVTIISGVLLSYIFYPFYFRLKKIVRSENLASLLTALLVVIIITVPLIFAGNALVNESVAFFQQAKTLDFQKIEAKIPESITKNVDFNEQLKEFINKFSLTLARETSEFIVSLPAKALHFFVMLFIMFYLFKEGKDLVKKIKRHIPLKEKYRKDLAKKMSGVVYASLYGLVITAIVQGTVGAIGLWIFQVPSPVLWGVIMIILSMLPVVGAFLVWFPAAMYKLVLGDIFNGVGLLLYGLFVISTIDNIIRPKIIGSKGKIHPILVLLGVLGGLEVFGLLGMIIGPLVLALMMVFLGLYVYERKN